MQPWPGRPTPKSIGTTRSRQAGAERFHRELTSLMQARLARRCDYNTVRPHSRIGWLTPAAFAAKFSSQQGQGAPPFDGSASWPVAPITTNLNRQTLVAPG